jgi:hypothetical protein
LKLRGIKPFKFLAISVFVIALLAYQPEAVGFTFCFLYALSGFFEWAVGWKKPTEDDEIFTPFEDDESMMEPGDGENGARELDGRRDPVVHKLGVRGGAGEGPKLN